MKHKDTLEYIISRIEKSCNDPHSKSSDMSLTVMNALLLGMEMLEIWLDMWI